MRYMSQRINESYHTYLRQLAHIPCIWIFSRMHIVCEVCVTWLSHCMYMSHEWHGSSRMHIACIWGMCDMTLRIACIWGMCDMTLRIYMLYAYANCMSRTDEWVMSHKPTEITHMDRYTTYTWIMSYMLHRIWIMRMRPTIYLEVMKDTCPTMVGMTYNIYMSRGMTYNIYMSRGHEGYMSHSTHTYHIHKWWDMYPSWPRGISRHVSFMTYSTHTYHIHKHKYNLSYT